MELTMSDFVINHALVSDNKLTVEFDVSALVAELKDSKGFVDNPCAAICDILSKDLLHGKRTRDWQREMVTALEASVGPKP